MEELETAYYKFYERRGEYPAICLASPGFLNRLGDEFKRHAERNWIETMDPATGKRTSTRVIDEELIPKSKIPTILAINGTPIREGNVSEFEFRDVE